MIFVARPCRSTMSVNHVGQSRLAHPYQKANMNALQWRVEVTSTLFLMLIFCSSGSAELQVGFSEIDVTPIVDDDHTVWMAGYGWNRKATGVHDPLYARCTVLSDGKKKIALAAVDVVGLQYPTVERIRNGLSGFDYVMVNSSHNHEGPDTIGIWGKTPFQRGVDEDYMSSLVKKVIQCVRNANESLTPVEAKFGTSSDERLVGDSRKPIVKDATLRLLRFQKQDGQLAGLLVQWNSHPEALGSKNTLITADFPYKTVKQLKEKYKCPIAYYSGAVGGLMAPPDNLFRDKNGRTLREGEFAYAEAYGQAVAKLAVQANENAKPIRLIPFRIAASPIAVPVHNPLYRVASLTGIVKRTRIKWVGDFDVTDAPIDRDTNRDDMCIQTEVGFLRLGELSVACIPGEIYPELVYGEFQEPSEPNADFPEAPLEPCVSEIMPDARWMLFGLANDEIGYIIPRRQWDQKPPYAYGRKKSQYGEVNSCGPDIAPIIMEALQRRVADLLEADKTTDKVSDKVTVAP